MTVYCKKLKTHTVSSKKFYRISRSPHETLSNDNYDAPEEVSGERKLFDGPLKNTGQKQIFDDTSYILYFHFVMSNFADKVRSE